MRTTHRRRSYRTALVAFGAVVTTAIAMIGLAPASAARVGPNAITPENWDHSAAVDARARQILRTLTLEQKADLATGELNNFFGFYNNPIPSAGIPAQTMADGPVGARSANPAATNGGKTTQLPSASALAATFDSDLARTYGAVVGQEAFRTGNNMSLAPSTDTARTALWGRAFEGFGEDPLLSGTLGGTYIQGVQSNPGVGATIKHFNVYNQETDRFNVDMQVSDRALHEIYNRAFQIGISTGHPAAAMCSFNKINGVTACGSALLTSMLKSTNDFRGFVMSDYNATPDTVNAANAGLDQEQPGDQGPNSANFGARLVAAVQAGTVPVSRVNDMCLRILRGMIGLGLLTTPPTVAPLDIANGRDVARRTAAQGMVLLKNKNATLPIASRTSPSIAVIGPDADNTSADGGGSSTVSKPTAAVSPLEGITKRAGSGVDVTYSPGTDGISDGSLLPGPAAIPSSVLTPDGGGADDHGLTAQYWDNTTFSGDPHLEQTDPVVNLSFGFQNFPGFSVSSPKIPTNRGDFALLGDMSARWTGTITAPATADYELGLTARGTATLTLDGKVLVRHTGDLSSVSKSVSLVEGEEHTIANSYSAPRLNTYQGAEVRLFWEHPDDVLSPMMAEAVEAAKAAQTAIVVVRDYETEGVDRPNLDLPNEQDQLLRAVSKVNPRTIAVVETGSPSIMSTWDKKVAAVVQAWYPGQEQGSAIADVLFGDVNPAGRLPVSAPKTSGQAFETTPGTNRLTEGIYVGYRGYSHNNSRPQYPFGYGLSYTKFAYSDLTTTVTGGTKVTARVTVTNTGDSVGADTPQFYVGKLPTSAVDTPPRQLAGWSKIKLGPGESKRVSVVLSPGSMSYWDSYANEWIMPSGNLRVFVGTSSTKFPLNTVARIASNDVEGGGAISQRATYSIVNSVNSKCLDAENAGTTAGTAIQLYACPAPAENQQWTFTSTSGGYFTISGVDAADKVLGIDGGDDATDNGAAVELQADAGLDSQQFRPVRIGDGNYRFQVLSSGKCLGIADGSDANGAKLEQQTCSARSTAQAFRLDRIES